MATISTPGLADTGFVTMSGTEELEHGSTTAWGSSGDVPVEGVASLPSVGSCCPLGHLQAPRRPHFGDGREQESKNLKGRMPTGQTAMTEHRNTNSAHQQGGSVARALDAAEESISATARGAVGDGGSFIAGSKPTYPRRLTVLENEASTAGGGGARHGPSGRGQEEKKGVARSAKQDGD